MKVLIITMLIWAFCTTCNLAQTKFGFADGAMVFNSDHPSSPDPSSAMDIGSPNKGVLFPRLTGSQRNSILNPAEGLIIFNSSINSLEFFDGANWKQIAVANNLQKILNSGTEAEITDYSITGINTNGGFHIYDGDSDYGWNGHGFFADNTQGGFDLGTSRFIVDPSMVYVKIDYLDNGQIPYHSELASFIFKFDSYFNHSNRKIMASFQDNRDVKSGIKYFTGLTSGAESPYPVTDLTYNSLTHKGYVDYVISDFSQASSTIGSDNLMLRSDGGSRGLQGSGVSIGDDNALTNLSQINMKSLNSGTGTLIQFLDANGTDIGEITFSGTTTTYGTSSDYRMKYDIQKSTIGHQWMYDILRDYRWKADNISSTGVIAQELYKHFPMAVYAPDYGMWSVDYGKLTIPLIQGWKSQERLIESLIIKNQSLAEKANSLRAKIDQLEKELETL